MDNEELAEWIVAHDEITAKNGRLNKEELIKYFGKVREKNHEGNH